MAINLFETHAKPLDTMYTEESYLKGKTSNQWSWDGAKTIKITSIVCIAPVSIRFNNNLHTTSR